MGRHSLNLEPPSMQRRVCVCSVYVSLSVCLSTLHLPVALLASHLPSTAVCFAPPLSQRPHSERQARGTKGEEERERKGGFWGWLLRPRGGKEGEGMSDAPAAGVAPKTGWEKLLEETDNKKFAPATDRNKDPIFEMLCKYVPEAVSPPQGAPKLRVLEIASGTGQHAHFMAPQLHVQWTPSDFDPRCRASVEAYTSALPCVDAPLTLDASTPFSEWGVGPKSIDLLLCCNMVHIAPYDVMEGLLKGAGQACKDGPGDGSGRGGGMMFIYGPFKVGGKCTTESNADFDRSLRDRDTSYGIRDLEDVQEKAAAAGFRFVAKEEMPANNFLLVFQK